MADYAAARNLLPALDSDINGLGLDCTCGTPGLNYEGPEEDCEVHGEYRATLIEQRNAYNARLDAVTAMRDEWSECLGRDQCPSCFSSLGGCDHEEGYHHALSDLNKALGEGTGRGIERISESTTNWYKEQMGKSGPVHEERWH